MNCFVIDKDNRLKKILHQKVRHHFPTATFHRASIGDESLHSQLLDVDPSIVFVNANVNTHEIIGLLRTMSSSNFHIVFVTPFNPNLVNLLKLSNTDYLTTPILTEQLGRILHRAINESPQTNNTISITTLLYNLEHNLNQEIKIVLPSVRKHTTELLHRIIRLETTREGTRLHLTSNRQRMTTYRTSYLRDMLEQYGFYQVDRSHVINTDHVMQFYQGKTVLLSNGDRIQINARHQGTLARCLRNSADRTPML